jgi:choline dehydrogenase-like flavoprotein
VYSSANQLPNGTTLTGYDICIAGAGAAGIAIAQRLIGSSKKVLLLANGAPGDTGTQPDQPLQSIYNGTLGAFMTSVDPAFLTRSRMNKYGGTTNHFFFNARPLDEIDLLPRRDYRDAFWPLTLDELNQYYPAANLFGAYGPFNYDDQAFWAGALRGQPFPAQPTDLIQSVIFHGQSNPALYQFQSQCGPALQAASNVTVLFNAHVLKIETTPDQTSVTGLSCAAIDGGKPGGSFQITAGAYVLALGGIEPVRLLKLSGNPGDNAKGHLGRGFMLHPLIEEAAMVTFPAAQPVDPKIQNFYRRQTITLSEPQQTGAAYTLARRTPMHPGALAGQLQFDAWASLAPTPDAILNQRMGAFHANLNFQPDATVLIAINWESVPNENSVITLDPVQVDPVFGQPVVHLDWNLLDEEKHTITSAMELLREFMLARGAVGFEITTNLSGGPEQWTFSPDLSDPTALQAGDHHMGALRMSAAPEDGIVDVNCKVHTLDNLYIAGSGVFPTTGHANPTLTIVALALRLADHLKATLR